MKIWPLLCCWLLACAPKAPKELVLAQKTSGPPAAEVRYRMQEAPNQMAQNAMAHVDGSVWDGGLQRAVEELLSLTTHRSFSLDPRTTSLVAARAGFPGQAQFTWVVNKGELPIALLQRIPRSSGVPIHMAIAPRKFGDGRTLWMLGWSQKWADIDPIPRDLELDQPINIRVELPEGGKCQLYIRPPDGAVEVVSLSNGVARWVDRFQVPGEYRIEVLATKGQFSRVVHLFSVYVDHPPDEPAFLRMVPTEIQSPIEAERWVFEELNRIRVAQGFAPVKRFALFDEVARQHSAYMASYGRAVHQVPRVTEGVSWAANNLAHPRAHHHESVATALTMHDAMFLIEDSPGHLERLLCETCTHASVGVALEPVLDRFPRLFVTVDLLEFPQGPPKEIRH